MRAPAFSPLQREQGQVSGVTSTDIWKFLGLLLITLDHIGLYFLPEETGLRVFGRISIPIWFFLIGYSKPEMPPRLWLVYGIVLTGLDIFKDGFDDAFRLNILLNYALAKLIIALTLSETPLPAFKKIPLTWRIVMIALLGWMLFPLSHQGLEYGSIAWGFALAGFMLRHAQAGRASPFWLFVSLFILTGCGFAYIENVDFGFSPLQQAVLFFGLAAVLFGLSRFVRRTLSPQPPALFVPILLYSGRYSLEIYAGQLALFTFAAMMIEH